MMKVRSLLMVVSMFAASRALATPPDSVRILFIGNSLTYTNDLPAMVAAIGDAGGRHVITASASFPNFSLDDHLLDGRAMTLLQPAKWDFVVLQQGPTTQLESRQQLVRAVGRFAKAIRESGARPVLFSAWPARARTDDFRAIAMSFRLAARSVDGIFAPAGDVWVRAWRSDPAIAFHGPDGFHPSAAGSFAAALTIYRVTVGTPPPGVFENDMPMRIAGPSLGLSTKQLRIIATAVEDTVR